MKGVENLIQGNAHAGKRGVDSGAVGGNGQGQNHAIRQGYSLSRIGTAGHTGRQIGAVEPGCNDLIAVRGQQACQISGSEIAAYHGKSLYVTHMIDLQRIILLHPMKTPEVMCVPGGDENGDIFPLLTIRLLNAPIKKARLRAGLFYERYKIISCHRPRPAADG